MTDLKTTNSSIALSRMEIARLVNQYIGVSGGYLGDFSYRTHADFYTNLRRVGEQGGRVSPFSQILNTLFPHRRAILLEFISLHISWVLRK